MRKLNIGKVSTEALVTLFADLSKRQGDALIVDDTRRSNRIFYRILDIDSELRARGPEARLKLKALLIHPNPFVRMNAAVKILGLVPQEARSILQEIDDARVQPEALHAGMKLLAFDRGEWVPD